MPWRSNSFGISKDRVSCIGLFAPSLARWVHSSSPVASLSSLDNLNSVVAILLHSRWTVFLKKAAFLMLIQPLSSQVCRCFVRLLMAYLNSVIIVMGQKCGTDSTAIRMAAISPVWPD